MNHLNPKRMGLALGALFGTLHLVWSVLVALKWAQPLIDFIFKIHMMTPVIVVNDFNAGSALLLIVITYIIGFVVGFVFAKIWNKVHPRVD